MSNESTVTASSGELRFATSGVGSGHRRFVTELSNLLGVVALVAATPLLLLLLRLAIVGRDADTHPGLQIAAGLLMLITIAGLHLSIAGWLTRSRWRHAIAIRWPLLSVPAISLVVGLVAIGGGWGWFVTIAGVLLLLALWRGELAAVGFLPEAAAPDTQAEADAAAVQAKSPELDLQAEEPVSTAERLCQRTQRQRVDGQEIITIWQRVDFPAFGRDAIVHFPFWPALRAKPAIESEVVGSTPAQVAIEQVELHGCRLKIRLDEADERPQHVELEVVFTAQSETSSGDA